MQRKPIFDAVRKMLGRGFTPTEVERLDEAIDFAASSPRSIGPAGTALIKRFEGCALIRNDGRVEAYPDPGTGGEPWTIGWGATGRDIRAGTVWSQAQCDARLDSDLARFSAEVTATLNGAPTTQSQFDALVSFHYNTGAIARATLAKRHIAGDFEGARKEFSKWIHAGGKPLSGLRRRRDAEAELYSAVTYPIQ